MRAIVQDAYGPADVLELREIDRPVPRDDDLLALKELAEQGEVTPVVDRTFPLAEAAAAVRHLKQGHPQGKVVLTV